MASKRKGAMLLMWSAAGAIMLSRSALQYMSIGRSPNVSKATRNLKLQQTKMEGGLTDLLSGKIPAVQNSVYQAEENYRLTILSSAVGSTLVATTMMAVAIGVKMIGSSVLPLLFEPTNQTAAAPVFQNSAIPTRASNPMQPIIVDQVSDDQALKDVEKQANAEANIMSELAMRSTTENGAGDEAKKVLVAPKAAWKPSDQTTDASTTALLKSAKGQVRSKDPVYAAQVCAVAAVGATAVSAGMTAILDAKMIKKREKEERLRIKAVKEAKEAKIARETEFALVRDEARERALAAAECYDVQSLFQAAEILRKAPEILQDPSTTGVTRKDGPLANDTVSSNQEEEVKVAYEFR